LSNRLPTLAQAAEWACHRIAAEHLLYLANEVLAGVEQVRFDA
jgi:hypothetical protein